MNMLSHIIALIWGIIVGFSISVPIGPVGVICVQRTISKRVLAGLITGLGALVGDIFMASVGIFGIKSISDFIHNYQNIIRLVGSFILIGMGVSMLISKNKEKMKVKDNAITYIEYFISSLAIVITNPLTAAAFFLIFAGISKKLLQEGGYFGFSIIIGVAIGCALWWLLLTFIANIFGHLIKESHLSSINKFFGVVVIIIGLVVIGQLILKFLFI